MLCFAAVSAVLSPRHGTARTLPTAAVYLHVTGLVAQIRAALFAVTRLGQRACVNIGLRPCIRAQGGGGAPVQLSRSSWYLTYLGSVMLFARGPCDAMMALTTSSPGTPSIMAM